MHQAIGVRDALRAYTVGGAYAGGDAGRLGRIAPGMLADLVLLSDDPLRIPRERLLDLRVVATVFDGRIVYPG
jgi:predicted amidohydrolase YtcJ